MWNGSVPTAPNWKGDEQTAGGEELYTTPSPATTATNPSIGIVDGNLIPLPTSYNSMNIATLTTTNINNAEDIQTATINGNPVPVSANLWSYYPAVNDVVANQTQASPYTLNLFYPAGEDASFGFPYTNYRCLIAGATMNPLERLDPWKPGDPYDVGVYWGALYEGVEYITIANNVGDVLPTNPAYFRPANYDNAYGYSADDIVYQPTGISPGWYQSDNGSTGVAPPNLFAWTPINFWGLSPYVPDPAWDIKGFKDVQSASVHTDELVVANQTTLGDGGDALVVNGGTTLDGGTLHGTTIGSLPVGGINTVRLDVLPVGIEMTSITGIIMNSTLATEIAAGGGLVLAAGGAASLAAGGALSLAGGDYIEYNTDENRFINTSSGNDYTDIKVGNIFPAHNGSANLHINGGGSGRGVELADVVSLEANAIIALELLGGNITTFSYVNIPESSNLPENWSGAAVYNDLYALVTYAPTDTLYFNIVAPIQGVLPLSPIWDIVTTYAFEEYVTDLGITYRSLQGTNVGNDPPTSPTFWAVVPNNGWLLGVWDIATTYELDYPTFHAPTQSFWTSLQNGNVGNDPIPPALWDITLTYAVGDRVSYNDLYYESLLNSNNANLPDELGSVWWVQTTIYWSPSQEYNLGNTDKGIVFTPIVSGGTGITTLVKRYGDPDEELNVIVKNPFGVELSAQSVVTSPMYKEFDLGGQNIANASIITGQSGLSIVAPVGNISASASNEINLTAVTDINIDTDATLELNAVGDINLTSTGETNVQSGGSLVLNSSTADTSLFASTNIAITSTTAAVNISSGTNVSLNPTGDVLLNNKNITGANTITGTTALTLATTGNNNINISPAGTGLIVANKGLNMSNLNITNANTITGQGALTLATTGATNLNLSPASTGLIVAGKGLSMGTNSITNCLGLQSATGLAITTLSGTIEFTPSGTNRTNFNTDCGFNNKTLYNFTGTNVGGIYGLTTQALALVGQQATPAVTIKGALTMWLNSTTQAPGNSINGVTSLNGQGALTLASTGATNINLSPGAGGVITANKTLDMNGNTIINCPTIFTPAYAQVYSSANQTNVSGAEVKCLFPTTAVISGITNDTTNNRLVFPTAGTYSITWTAFFIHGGGGLSQVILWLRKNGTDVAFTGQTNYMNSQLNYASIGKTENITLAANDYLEFFWAQSGVNLTMTAEAAFSSPYTFPGVPSFSVSAERIA